MNFKRLWINFVLLVWLSACAPISAASSSPVEAASTQTPAVPTAATAPIEPTALPLVAALLTAEPGCVETVGTVEAHSLKSASLPRELQVRVYLPPCYSAQPRTPYPLLILLHGQSAPADQWEQLGIGRAADTLIARGLIRPLIIVMPYEVDQLANPYESGYGNALVEDLLPWVGRSYPACVERGCRWIGGLSRGAAWAMYVGLSHPDLFSAIGAHSYPSFYGDSARLPYLAREIPAGMAPRIWMDSGRRDRYLSQARHFHELLDQVHLVHEFHLFAGEHDEAYWSRYIEEYLRWYAGQNMSEVDCGCTPNKAH